MGSHPSIIDYPDAEVAIRIVQGNDDGKDLPSDDSEWVLPSSDSESEPDAEPDAEPAAEPASEPAPETAAEPAPEPAAEPAAEPATEPAAEPAAKPATEPAAEPARPRPVRSGLLLKYAKTRPNFEEWEYQRFLKVGSWNRVHDALPLLFCRHGRLRVVDLPNAQITVSTRYKETNHAEC